MNRATGQMCSIPRVGSSFCTVQGSPVCRPRCVRSSIRVSSLRHASPAPCAVARARGRASDAVSSVKLTAHGRPAAQSAGDQLFIYATTKPTRNRVFVASQVSVAWQTAASLLYHAEASSTTTPEDLPPSGCGRPRVGGSSGALSQSLAHPSLFDVHLTPQAAVVLAMQTSTHQLLRCAPSVEAMRLWWSWPAQESHRLILRVGEDVQIREVVAIHDEGDWKPFADLLSVTLFAVDVEHHIPTCCVHAYLNVPAVQL